MSAAVKKSNSIEMTSGPILPGMLAMAIPLAASSVLQLVFNAADLVVVGNYGGEHSLAAVGSTGALVNLTVNLFVGLSIGATALASRYLGAGNVEGVRKTVRTSIALSVISGAILTALGVGLARQALIWMRSPESTLELSTLYLRVYFLGMIPLMVYNFGAALLRAKGDTKRPLYYLATAGVVNVFLNLFFVIVLDMDVAGVALATIISQALSAFFVIRALTRETDAFQLDLRRATPDWGIVVTLLKIGVPAGFQGVIFSLSNVVIQGAINGFGEIVMAGSAASQQLEGFVWLSMNSFCQCGLTYASQNYGAGNYSRINRVTFTACACAMVTGLILGNTAYYFGDHLLGIFDQRSEVIEAGRRRLFWVACFYGTCGLMDSIVGTIRGIGYNMTPTVVSLLGACGLRLLWIGTIFQVPRFHTESVLFLSYPVSWLATFAIHFVCYCLMMKKARAESRALEQAPAFLKNAA